MVDLKALIGEVATGASLSREQSATAFDLKIGRAHV